MRCFRCQQEGHIAQNCNWAAETAYPADLAGDGRPPWCGTCDPRTRHVDLGNHVRRCECHPESHKLLPHHRRCPQCKAIVVQWDNADCGRHLLAGVTRPYGGPAAIPDDEYQRRFAVTEPPPDKEFAGGLPDPPEYPLPDPAH